MRLLVFSDLHLEMGIPLSVRPGLQFDVVVLAGDIHSPGHKAALWAQSEPAFAGKPVLLVPGNHEFYSCEVNRELALMERTATGSNVHLLSRGSFEAAGVRFLGCTLWTDFLLPVSRDDMLDPDVRGSLEKANRAMNDYQRIEVPAEASPGHLPRQFNRLMRAEDTLAMHWIERDWLRSELRKPFKGSTVVVTHHAPAAKSIAPKYAGHRLTPAFASELPIEMFANVALWIHGHTHFSSDYEVNGCRVISNPRGYALPRGPENPEFDDGLVVQVESTVEDS